MQALGAALMQNKTLRTLIVSNNGIEARACFTICAGVLEHPRCVRAPLWLDTTHLTHPTHRHKHTHRCVRAPLWLTRTTY